MRQMFPYDDVIMSEIPMFMALREYNRRVNWLSHIPMWPYRFWLRESELTSAWVDTGLRSISLHWCHNDHGGVSNHQPHGCLLNCLFRRRSKKTSKLRVTGHCAGNSPGPVNSPHKGPVMRKMAPFDDVIMCWFGSCDNRPPEKLLHM